MGEILFRVLDVIQVILGGVWIYLVWIVWRKKINIFHDQMEPKLAERRLKRLKAFLLVAAISFVVYVASIPLDNTITASIFMVLSLIATIGGLVIFLKGRRKQHKGIPK